MEGGHRVVVLAILPVGSPEIVIGELVVRIYIERFLESRDRIVTLPPREVGEAKIVPRVLVLRFDIDGALEQLNREREFAVAHGSARALVEVVRLHVRRRSRRASWQLFDGQVL